MLQPELLETVVRALERIGVEFMLTGSIVSSMQGQPRSTHDIDLVVQIDERHAEKLIEQFPSPRYYVSEQAVRQALRQQSMFNLLDTVEGGKVDFWILTGDPFDRSRFARRYVEDAGGLQVPASAPEDTILAKLRWSKLSGGSEKQFGDALGVYELQYGNLDHDYLEHWAGRLGVQSLWNRLRDEAEPLV